MKELLTNINKAFENRIRLGIMSVLMANNSMDFTGLREILDVTDGNLSSHLKALEEAGYIEVEKRFLNRKPNTSYSITNLGYDSFKIHIKALEELLKNR